MAQQPSHACCTVPPVVAQGYSPKGSYTTVQGLKAYATGNSGAKTGVIIIYDIFGFFNQTLQGADILAAGDKERKYQVFMPDFFDGKPFPLEKFPPKTDENKKALNEFFTGPAAIPKTMEKLPKIVQELQSQNSGISQWAIIGFCWGGKIANLASQKDTIFKAAVSAHPGSIDPKDATDLSIPFLMIATKDEDKDLVQKWDAEVKTAHQVEFYDDQIHGFMAARADLQDENVKKGYAKAYEQVLNFFHTHIPA